MIPHPETVLPALTTVPERRQKQYEDAERLKAPHEHGQRYNGLAERRQRRIRAGCAEYAERRTAASHGGNTDAYGLKCRYTVPNEKNGP